MLNSVDLNSSSNTLLISLASFLLAVAGRAGSDFLQLCRVSCRGALLWAFSGYSRVALTTTSERSQKCVDEFDFTVPVPPSLLSSFRPPVVPGLARSVVLYFVECDKYTVSWRSDWRFKGGEFLKHSAFCDLLIWLKLTMIVLIIITTLLLLHFIPSNCAFRDMYE